MSGFVVRIAEVGDADVIAHVHIASRQETYRGLMSDSVLALYLWNGETGSGNMPSKVRPIFII